ncbi:MAG TPA: 7TM diverse intracellular signaling domain-containing protein [Saprospiraceae bacterium]|nr:7TM diverse intracellular signaling domain-containing protein [Saprospiraceae bacterium]
MLHTYLIRANFKILVFSLFIIIKAVDLKAQSLISLSERNKIYTPQNSFLFLTDQLKKFSSKDISTPEFQKALKPATVKDFNFGLSNAAIWYKISLANITGDRWLLKVGNPTLEDISLFTPTVSGKFDSIKLSLTQNMKDRPWQNNNYILNLPFTENKKQDFYLRITSKHSMLIPIEIATADALFVSTHYDDIWAGVYLGFILVMAVFNFFIFISVRDISYLYYVLYISSIGLLISMHNGYPFELLWGNAAFLNVYLDLLTSLAGIFATLFTMHFLNTKVIAPRIHTGLRIILGMYILAGIIVLAGQTALGSVAEEITGLFSSLYLFFAVIYIYKNGYKAARFYLLAWSTLLIGIIFFVLGDAGIFNARNIINIDPLQLGSALESLLLSFALADRFSMYKKEKEELVLQQNLILESKVNERTAELSATLEHLKETQAQLILQEKLASLGKMTSGIAHEIQNPLNFVNNFSDLSRELINEAKETNDEKERNEILDDLESNLEKIFHHGQRADSIVKNMLMHSRTGGKEKELTDINILVTEALNFSYSGMKSKKLGFNCVIEKALDEQIPRVNIIPQDISRVILNLFNNAFYAVKDKTDALVKVSTSLHNNECEIKIWDNGSGIPDDIKQKIFEPFFTTKPSGEGTGLGLSISYEIILSHGGEMKVESVKNKFTEFSISFTI